MDCTRATAVFALGIVQGSCTLAQEFDLVQCDRSADCAKLGKQYSELVCEDHQCVVPGCESDSDCVMRGGDFASYICESGVCEPPACSEDAECKSQGSTHVCVQGRCDDVAWGCLNDPPDTAEAENLTFLASIGDTISMKAPADTLVVACRSVDFECSAPVAGPLGQGPDGLFEITIPQVPSTGFTGLLRITAAGQLDTYFHFVSPLVRSSQKPSPAIFMFSEGSAAGLAAVSGITIDAVNKAALFSRVFDCTGKPAAGVVFEMKYEGEEPPSFFAIGTNSVPDPEADRTSAAGLGGFVNVPPGYVSIAAKLADDGRLIKEFPLRVRAHTLTHTAIFP